MTLQDSGVPSISSHLGKKVVLYNHPEGQSPQTSPQNTALVKINRHLYSVCGSRNLRYKPLLIQHRFRLPSTPVRPADTDTAGGALQSDNSALLQNILHNRQTTLCPNSSRGKTGAVLLALGSAHPASPGPSAYIEPAYRVGRRDFTLARRSYIPFPTTPMYLHRKKGKRQEKEKQAWWS